MRPVLLVAALVMAGCSAGPEHAEAIDWVVLDVDTTATEPVRGPIRIAWQGDLFGIYAHEEDLARQTIRGEAAYTTTYGMGWMRVPADQWGTLSNRIQLWDLRFLLEHGEATTRQDGDVTVHAAKGSFQHGTATVSYDVAVRTEGRRIIEASLSSPQGRESPFRFTPADVPLGFALERPADARLASELRDPTGQARDGHALLINLIQDRHDTPTRGLPQEVTPQSMQLEMVRRGAQWPDNPFFDQPMRDEVKSGHFSWARCSAQDGTYVGYGWDGAILSRNWGQGCPVEGRPVDPQRQ